jgi:hypothetical protein
MSIFKKIIFTLILLSLSLGVIELVAFTALKIKNIPPDGEGKMIYHPLRHHAFQANYFVNKWPNLKTDKYGYIITPETPKNPDITIVLSGSSSARNPIPFSGANKTIAALLQKRLNEEMGISIAVINTAVGGYQAFYEFMTLYEYFEHFQLKADMILSLNGLLGSNRFSNELGYYLKHNQIYDIYNTQWIFDGKYNEIINVLSRIAANSDLNTAKLVRVMVSKYKQYISNKELKKKKILDNYADNTEVDKLYQKLLLRDTAIYDMIDILAKSHGASYEFVLLPASYSWKNRTEDMSKETYLFREYFRGKYSADVIERDVPYSIYDFSGVFDSLDIEESPYTKPQQTHYNDIGTAYLVEALMKIIKPSLQEIIQQKASQ